MRSRSIFFAFLALGAACGDSGAGSTSTSSGAGTTGSVATGSAAVTTGAGAAGGAGGSGACPAGSTLIRAIAECAGAGAIPDAMLVAGIESSGRGNIVPLGPLDVPGQPCPGVEVCRPDDAPTLLFSDEPEIVAADGILYADVVQAGKYRAYVYHVNGGSSLRKFSLVALNEGASDATITISRHAETGPSASYAAAGKAAALAWIQSTGSAAVMVPAGKRVVVDASLDGLHAGHNKLVHGIVDFATDRALKVSVVSVAASADAAVVTAGLSVIPSSGLHVRGTFPGASFIVRVSPSTAGGVRAFDLGNGSVEPDLDGHSFVDANAAVVLAGNFGVDYDLQSTSPGRSGWLFSARGGSWAAAADISSGDDAPEGPMGLPAFVTSLDPGMDAAHAGRFAAGQAAEMKLLTGGGLNLPVALLFVPLP